MEQDSNLNPDPVSLFTNRTGASLEEPKSSKNSKLPNNKRNAWNTKSKPVVNSKTNRGASVLECRLGINKAAHQTKSRLVGKSNRNPETRSKKRSSDGQLKEPSSHTIHTNDVTKTREDCTNLHHKDSTLQQDILALGGSKDDLDLIEGEASESEVDGEAFVPKITASKELRNELLRYVQELGIKEVPREAQEDSGSEEHETKSLPRNAKSTASETMSTDLSLLQTPRNGTTKPVCVCIFVLNLVPVC